MKSNDIFKFLSELQILGIKVHLFNNKLQIKGNKSNISDEILKEIKLNKQEIISFLDSNSIKKQKIKILPSKRNTEIPLSFAQERLWFIDQYEHNASYNIPGAVKLIGKLDTKVLEKTFSEIIRRHEALRTNFFMINNVASQLIHKESKFELKTVDQSHLSVEEANQKNKELIEIESQKPFDLANDSLIRLVLYKINIEEHTLFLNQHHIISDGWSSSIFFKEISILYKAFSENKPSPLPELEIQYADYAVWQREQIEGDVLIKQSEYWKNKLTDTAILELPADKPRPGKQTFNGSNLHFSLNKVISEKLNTFNKENDVTLFMTLLSAFKVLLNKYTGQDDICVGTPIANRTRSEIEPLIGIFVNTLALRSDLSGDISFIDLLKQIKQTTLDAYDNQDIPFEKVVDIVQPERNLSYSPLFQVMMVLQNNPTSELSFGELSLKPVEFKQTVSKFDLTLNFTETAEGLIGRIEYNTELFDKDRIERMIGHFKVIVESIISNPTVSISELEVLTSAEKQQLLVEWNNTNTDYPKNKCIHQLFEQQAEKTPDNIAVVFEKEELTYRQLNEKANNLGHYLKKKGAKPETLVGICVDRSLEMIVGLLGIIKAGGAYVPIDPAYPEERISFMLEDADCGIVLTQEQIELPMTNSEIIYLDTDWDKIENEPTENVKSGVKSDSLIYVIYTSGSTGYPKGTLIEHRNVVRLFSNDKFQFNFSENDVWYLFHSYCFDFSVWEMYGALLFGGKLIVIPKETAIDTRQFCQLLESQKVTILNQTPSAFYNLSDEVERKKTALSIRYVIFGGEALTPSRLRFWYDNYVDCKLINMYGITETTVHVTYKEITELEINNNICNIGKPIPTLSTYILDENKNLLPIGVHGELCVTGAGVCRGYLNNDILSAEKFQDNPFVPGEKIYMSGDSAFVNELGELIYCGRIDNQVKIRGFRIELGEIEATINKIKTIKDCVLVAKDDTDGNKRLVSYIVSDDEINVQEIREALSKSLPDYMVPSLFVSLEKMPLTPNGKIDRKALPEPEGNIETTNEYVAPRNEIEEKLVKIWSEVLNVPQEEISTAVNFFELGGHSLRAINLINKIHKEFDVKIPLVDVFNNQCVGDLGCVIKASTKNQHQHINICEKKEYYNLSSAQKRTYISSQLDKSGINYNVPMTFILEGTLDINKLEGAFVKLIDRHESLRTSFRIQNNSHVQVVLPKVEFKLDIFECSSEQNSREIIKEFVVYFDLSIPPLFRVGLVKLNSKKHILVFDIHHIIIDGVSQGIFSSEIIALYNENVLLPLKYHYKDYSEWHNSLVMNNTIKQQEEYWLNEFSGEIPVLDLPYDNKREDISDFSGSSVQFDLSVEQTKVLKELCLKENATMYMVLLGVYNVLLSKITNQYDIVVGTPIAGRSHGDFNKIIGMFVNTIAQRNYPEGDKSFIEFLREVRDRSMQAFANQEYQFDDLINELYKKRGLEQNLLFKVMFAQQNAESERLDISFNDNIDLQMRPYENIKEFTQFDLNLHAFDYGDRIGLILEYSDKLFNGDTISDFIEVYLEIVSYIVKDNNIKLSDIQFQININDTTKIVENLELDFL